MGWLAYERPKGQSDLDHLRRELCGDESRHRLLAGATVASVFYGAVLDADNARVWAVVVLQQRGRCGGGYNYARKVMGETDGPVQARCPARILDLLSPLPGCEHDPGDSAAMCTTCYARKWRERCRAAIARAAARPRLSNGDVFRFVRPVTFVDDVSETTFIVVDARRRRYRRVKDGSLVRLGARDGWPDYELVNERTSPQGSLAA